MARNSEKAQSMLFRFRAAQAADMGIIDLGRTRRPKNITSIDSVPTCEKWRGQVLKEVSRKVTRIQDESLSDFAVRDLNDEINRLMREKWAWEAQIRNLGGPNYMRGARVLDEDGREVPGGGKGYRYFGRARELPGVKELFEAASRRGREREEMERAGETGAALRARLGARVDAAYFGYNLDEEDGSLVEYEREREAEAAKGLLAQDDNEESKVKKRRGRGGAEPDEEEEWVEIPGDTGDGVGWRLPTLEEVQEELLERRKRRLLDRLGA